MTEYAEQITYLKSVLQSCGISISDDATEKVVQYHHLLEEKNKVMNLTAITDFEDAAWKHYADSLALMKYVDLKDIKTMLDVGSGAGIPGIPLKICCPWIKMTLLDSVQKKVGFHEEVFRTLNLENIESVHMRSEDAAHSSKMREKYDFVTARAVANLTTLSEYCLPFVKPGGLFVSYKAETAKQEQKDAEKAIKVLGGTIEQNIKYTIGDNTRSLIVIRKTEHTPKKYPRKAGTPLRDPIK